MHGSWIVDGGRNALRVERRRESVAVAAFRQPNGILRPHRGATAGEARNGNDIAERARVSLRHAVARGDLVLKNFHFLDQDCSLHGVEPSRESEADIVVLVRALAVDANAAQCVRQLGIVGEYGTAVTVAAERLGRKKAGCGGEAERAETTTLVARAEALCGVIQNEQALGFGDR